LTQSTKYAFTFSPLWHIETDFKKLENSY
jgi:hypothetical protein